VLPHLPLARAQARNQMQQFDRKQRLDAGDGHVDPSRPLASSKTQALLLFKGLI
jgi:hypothetical protein